MRLQIPESDTDEFVECYRKAILNKPYIRPLNEGKDALVLSFDKDMRPFFNYSKGWHRQKPYFERTPRIVSEIRAMMLPYRTAGGRVFIDNLQVYFVDDLDRRTNLCEVQWQKDRDVVSEIRNYRIRVRPGITLKKVFWAGSH